MHLTQQERDRLALWLDSQARSDEQFIAHMDQLPGAGATDAIAKKMRTRALAYRIVAAELMAIEFVSIGGG